MRNERKKQVMTLSILVAAVLVISVGFAAFSSTLRIKTKTTVTPNSSDFKVVFSSNADTLETNPVKPNVEGMGSDGEIDNTSEPAISGLTANFTNPGDEVTYTFYVRNEGKYEAFLNSISFRGKTCTPGEGASQTMVNDACKAIRTTVSVGNTKVVGTTMNIEGESLLPGESKQVTVTIFYHLYGTRVDGPFRVEFGAISMYYDVLSGVNEENDGEISEEIEEEIHHNVVIYRNSTESISIGDDIDTYLYETSPLNISQNYYLKHEVTDNKVTGSYACITYTENGVRKDACIRGGHGAYYKSNREIIRGLESYFNTLDYSSSSTGKAICYFDNYKSYCYSDSLDLRADYDGHAQAYDISSYCIADAFGGSFCRRN